MLDIRRRLQHSISRNEPLCLWIMSVLVFMLGIWRQPFINFETRFAVFAQEMLRNGPSLFPTTYGQPYPDYPVTSTLLIWLLSLPFGEVSKFTAVLPTAFASATVLALTYSLFAQYSKQWAVLAVCFEILTFAFSAEARSISVDQMISAITVAAFYLTNKSHREENDAPIRSLLLLLVAGFLVRGPIGVVIPAGVVLSHLVLTSGRRKASAFAAYGAGVLMICTTIQLGLAALFYGNDFVSDIVKMQAVSRFSESVPEPIYYYFTSSFSNYALSYPVAVFVVLIAFFSKFGASAPMIKEEHAELLALLVAWIAIVLAGLSIPETKKVRYILPVVPPLAGLASYVFVNSDNRLMKWLRRGVEGILIVLPLLAILLLQSQKTKIADAGIAFALVYGVLGTIFLVNISVLARNRAAAEQRAIPLCVLGAITSCFLQIVIVEPIDLHMHDTSGFVHRIEALTEKHPGKVVFYKENPDGLPIKYLVNARNEFSPSFIKNSNDLKNMDYPVWLLAREEKTAELQTAGVNIDDATYHDKFAKTPFMAIYLSAPP